MITGIFGIPINANQSTKTMGINVRSFSPAYFQFLCDRTHIVTIAIEIAVMNMFLINSVYLLHNGAEADRTGFSRAGRANGWTLPFLSVLDQQSNRGVICSQIEMKNPCIPNCQVVISFLLGIVMTNAEVVCNIKKG